MYAEMQGNTHEIVSATVTNLDMARGIVTLELSKGGVATLPAQRTGARRGIL